MRNRRIITGSVGSTCRQAILAAHPEVAQLEGSNHLTVPIGLAITVLHASVCVVCQQWGWLSVFVAAYTVGAALPPPNPPICPTL